MLLQKQSNDKVSSITIVFSVFAIFTDRFKLMRKEGKPNVSPDEIGEEAGLKYVDSVFTVRKTGFIYYLLTESEVITGKSQTKALMY